MDKQPPHGIDDLPGCFKLDEATLVQGAASPTPTCAMWTGVFDGTYHGAPVLMKEVALPDAAKQREIYRSVRLAMDMYHPNITQFFGVSFQNPEKKRVRFVTERLERGDLAAILASDEELSVQRCVQLMRDVACAMSYLHAQAKPILHRDLRAANVHISHDYRAKLVNFEFGGKLGLDKTLIGTPAWAAPEILAGDANYTEKVDVYSFAMLMLEIMNRKVPYSEEPNDLPARVLLGEIVEQARRPRIMDRNKWPRPLLHLVDSCWQKDPTERPSFDEIAAKLQAILNPPSSPNKRCNAARSTKAGTTAGNNENVSTKRARCADRCDAT
ncbi:TKL protein kinase [Saprolegnia parasitica CBS 223.65]|uniref:TKL protein kinase n=1 Tax=Saprolegnia parasitica (strain CBS 223.65) TaxID=695850 RepID=A0A067CCR3_SAPPC|nr:TKL protein kinase [Saprolegnia parasitica CBS 223.65]KDO28554.1 TKL protein kinase [Saprolegnia parasitica CBS 223.65]|eukprot:XP_012200619.1 TKL protein kinase [Saprolegnia parasitica CBS 223.65]